MSDHHQDLPPLAEQASQLIETLIVNARRLHQEAIQAQALALQERDQLYQDRERLVNEAMARQRLRLVEDYRRRWIEDAAMRLQLLRLAPIEILALLEIDH